MDWPCFQTVVVDMRVVTHATRDLGCQQRETQQPGRSKHISLLRTSGATSEPARMDA